MSLVTVLRSPSSESGSFATDSEVDQDLEDSSCSRSRASSFEGFFASKGAAYALPDGDFARSATKHGGEMQLHLQAMVNLLRDEDVLRLVVKLECQHPKRIRYLTVVSAFGPDDEEESIIMGVDWTDKATIGLVVPLYRDTNIRLDGDGGFKLSSAERTHDLKPVSVQTMWTALQWIHKCAENARRHNYYPNGTSHAWGNYYVSNITSDRSCLNEWNQMDDLLTKRPEPPDDLSPEKELIMKLIRHRLKEVMLRVDLEEITCRQIRIMLEEDTQMELNEYREFVDQEMITILGQMDSASKIFDHVYLGSEWNASNLEELKENGVGYILNTTKEIDNFFPGTFIYYNVRVYDVVEAELLHHWEHTYKFIQKAKEAGSKVLVHCKMGISRSASTVIAYGMKEFGWSLGDTMKYVKARRSCVSPNAGFWKQLITYEGILNSSKQRFNKLFSDRRTQSDSTEGKAKRTRTARKKPKKYNTMPVCTEQGKGESSAKSGGEDIVDNTPLESESIPLKSEASSEESEEESVEGRLPSEDSDDNGDDVFFTEAVSGERGEAVDVPSTSSPHASSTALSLQKELERSDELVENLSPVEKSALHRVSSLPTFLNGGRQDLLVEDSGNFRRSSSLRERDRSKLKHIGASSGDQSASAENLEKSSAEDRSIDPSSAEHVCVETTALAAEENDVESHNELEKPQAKDVVLPTAAGRMVEDLCKEPESAPMELESAPMELESAPMEPESAERVMVHSSLPRDLLGVVESGFVKRHSRNFEEGIFHLPSETEVFNDDVAVEEEDREGSDVPSAGDKLDQEDVKSFPGEEPEPGIVKKHKEGYEMKHRESAKTALSLKQISSAEGVDVKEDEGKVDVFSDVSCVPLEKDASQLAEGSETPSADQEVQPSGTAQYDHGFSVNVDALLQKVNEDMKKEVLSRRTARSRKVREARALADDESGNAKESLGSVGGENWTEHNGSYGVDLKQCVLESENPEVPVAGLVKRNTLILEGKVRDFSVQDTQQVEAVASKGEATSAAVTVWDQEPRMSSVKLFVEPSGEGSEQSLTVDEEMSLGTEASEGDGGSQQDTKDAPRKGLVKRHTLLIEERLQPLEQDASEDPAEKERESGMALTETQVSDSPSDEGQLRYQIEPTCADTTEEHAVTAEEDSEAISGLVKREKLRIEERLQPGVTPVAKEPTVSEMQAKEEDMAVLEGDIDIDVGKNCRQSDKPAQDDNDAIPVEEYDQSEVAIDTSSVVRVKEHAQHLENILHDNQPDSKTNVEDRAPRIVIVPRSTSVEKENTDNECTTANTMETLRNAKEGWGAEKATAVVNLATGNVKQRTQMLEDIIRDSDKGDWERDEDNERNGSSVCRDESMPKAIRRPARLVLRRRSFSDVTENSSISKRNVVYTVQLLKDSSTGSANSSSLPRNWSLRKGRSEDTNTKKVNTLTEELKTRS